jgi:L-lactate dehydrogenase complex protein LldG
MKQSKEIILNRIQNALGGKTITVESKISRDYRHNSRLDANEILQMFAERVDEYKAVTEIIREDEIQSRLRIICEESAVKKLVLPKGINGNWLNELSDSVQLLRDEPNHLSKKELNESDAVLTGCYLAVAQTGSIILNAEAGQGRRILTLLPDFHICIVKQSQIVEIFPEAIQKLEQTVRLSANPITCISGPSATSDIELNRVEGVHGPRKLHVLIVRGS